MLLLEHHSVPVLPLKIHVRQEYDRIRHIHSVDVYITIDLLLGTCTAVPFIFVALIESSWSEVSPTRRLVVWHEKKKNEREKKNVKHSTTSKDIERKKK